MFEELFARAMSFSFSLIPTLRESSYRSWAALERPMNLALGIAMRWLAKARFIEPCLTTGFV
jgi:2-phosphoglycerate kinase